MTIHTPKEKLTTNAQAAPSVTGPLSHLIAALEFCRRGMSREETRYYLCGVCLHWAPDGLHAVSTDGHGLTIWARTCTGQAISLDCVVQRIHADLTAAA